MFKAKCINYIEKMTISKEMYVHYIEKMTISKQKCVDYIEKWPYPNKIVKII